MSTSMSKAVTDIQQLLQKTKYTDKSKQTLWDVLSDQVEIQGEWDNTVINRLKEEIENWLTKLGNKKLKDLWLKSDSAIDNKDPNSETNIEMMKYDLAEELSNRILDQLENVDDEDEYFTPIKKKKSKFDDEDDDYEEGYDSYNDDSFSDDYFEEDDNY
ncbi:MAG: hypothetical protein JW995_11840 [Melioribacteraceae bacterium]|nr:hypothetical protein [Melioribacteraceae bacterium]